MENLINELKVKIEKARKELPTESVEAIDSINWKTIVSGMSEKYNSDQLENLTTETELLLCGLLSPEQYQKELELRMRISKNESTSLLGEMDKLIFKKMQNELERILAIKDKAQKNKDGSCLIQITNIVAYFISPITVSKIIIPLQNKIV